MAGYTRQETYTDGDVIQAAHTNDEFDQLVAAFAATDGHAHDGSTGGGGPIAGLLNNTLTFGVVGTAADTVITFTSSGLTGQIAWDVSADNFEIRDDVLLTTTEKLQFRDTGLYINSSVDGQLDIVADTELEITAPTIDLNSQITIVDGAVSPVVDSDVDLGTASLYYKNAYIDTITTTGNVDVGGNLTVTGTTTLNGGTLTLGDAATDNVVFGADVNSSIIPNTDDTYDLGSAGQEWRNLYVDGTANLDIVDIDGAVDMATTLQVDGVATFTGRDIHSGGITIANAGQIGSVGDPDAIAIASSGVVTFSQIPVLPANSIDSDAYVDGSIDNAHLADDAVGADELAANAVVTASIVDASVTTAKIADGNVTTAKIAADAVTGAKIADDTLNSEHYVAGSIDLEHMSANSVDSDQYVDGSIDTIHISADAITGAKIADDAIDSEHYADGSIDTAHIADSQITVAKMAVNSVDSDQYVDGSIDTAHIANLQITTGLIAADAVTAAKIADDVVNSEHYAAGSIDTEHIADSQITVAKMAANSIDSDQYVDGSIDNAHLADDAVGADELAANAVVNASVAAGAAINFSKMENLTTARALVSDGNGDVSVSAVTATEVGYLDGVTSAIQTQLDAGATKGFATAMAIAL